MKKICTVGAAAAFLAWSALGAPALAQTPPPTRIRGTIETVDGPMVGIKSRDGTKLSLKLVDPVTVMTVKPVELASVGPGAYVGVAAEPEGKDQLRAIEVLVFPEAMRGAGEGHYGWDLTPTSNMTNASVKSVVQARDGRDLELSYKGQTTKITVPPGVPVVTFAPAVRADVKPGAPVFLSGVKQPDGTYTASRIVVGTNGVAPPM